MQKTKSALKSKGGKTIHKGKATKDRKVKKPKRDDGWKFKAPRSNENTTAQIEGKTWNWCSIRTGAPSTGGCNMWTRHKPEQCKGYKYKGSEVKKTNSRKKYDLQSRIGKLQAQAAAMELVDTDEDEAYASE